MTEKVAIQELLTTKTKLNVLETFANALAEEKKQPGPFTLGNVEKAVKRDLELVGKQIPRLQMKVAERVVVAPLQKAGCIALGAVAGAAAGGVVGAAVGFAITAATADSLNTGEVLQE